MLQLLLFIAFLSIPRLAQAIPPPDFLFQVGVQLAQIFAIAAVFLSAFFATFLRVFKIYFQKVWQKKWFWALVVIFIVGLALAFAYWYQGQI